MRGAYYTFSYAHNGRCYWHNTITWDGFVAMQLWWTT